MSTQQKFFTSQYTENTEKDFLTELSVPSVSSVVKYSFCGVICLAMILGLSMQATVFAEEGKEKVKTTTAINEVEGEVSAISKDYIAIVYNRDNKTEYEVSLPIDKNVRIVHKKGLEQIGVGDIVNVQYEEAGEEGEEGQIVKRRIAKVVTFLKPAAVKPSAQDELVDEEVEDSAFPLKGIKRE